MRRIIIVAAAVLTLVACKDKKQSQQQEDKFPSITVPTALGSQLEAYSYLSVHFWDNFDLTDTARLNKQYAQRAFADYLMILAQMPQNVRQQSVDVLLNRAYKTEVVYDRMMDMFETLLYNVGSPLLNEETYNAVLLWQINNPNIDEDLKLRPRELYRVAQKNRVGSKAADFTYVTDKGMRTTLYNMNAHFTILFFYNLGCEMCRDLREQMLEYIANTPAVAQMISNGDIKILALYPDRERESWEKYKSDIPATWINGYDPTGAIKEKEVYELRAIPSVYVLDSDKVVLVKDAFNAEQIFGTILSYVYIE